MPYVQCIETYWTELDGTPVLVRKGENIQSSHQLVTANPARFKPIELSSRWDTVEQASADPGEKRAVGRRAPKG